MKGFTLVTFLASLFFIFMHMGAEEVSGNEEGDNVVTFFKYHLQKPKEEDANPRRVLEALWLLGQAADDKGSMVDKPIGIDAYVRSTEYNSNYPVEVNVIDAAGKLHVERSEHLIRRALLLLKGI